MRNIKNGLFEQFGLWTIQVIGQKVYVIGCGYDFRVHGSKHLQDLIEGLQACVDAVEESEERTKK